MSHRQSNSFLAISLSAAVLLLASCSGSDEKRAAEYYAKAETSYRNGNENTALHYIDSIHSEYPEAISVRRKADTLTWNIELGQMERSLPYLDSMMTLRQTQMPEATRKFVFIKDERYQDIGEFEHRMLRTENNTGRCYLKPYTNERGDLLMGSYYVGAKASHSVIKVTIGNIYKETSPAGESDKNGYMDLGQFRETILLPIGKLNGIPQFIAENHEEKIKITLTDENGGSPYSYYLNNNEKTIFLDTYRLAALLSEINELNRQYNKTSQKISYLKTKLYR